eukprot:CAMPEP_0171289048 /NCGR_PEP_ID=MMETSP0790-20130122/70405_1 /TAXON_ID=2925 /ORGANISM="Alexandrium catenella, Strain OF101" /LENGTH=64 /DNA_ID=CAMNT_0011758667 /DNA_START=12 /DNA_END=206 /DNA_ORIENTATION=+
MSELSGTWNDNLQRFSHAIRKLIRAPSRPHQSEGQEPMFEEPPVAQERSGAEARGSTPPEQRWL